MASTLTSASHTPAAILVQRVRPSPPLAEARALAKAELGALPTEVRALVATAEYPVYLEAFVARSRAELMVARRSPEASS